MTVTVADFVTLPPKPVHLREYTEVTVGLTCSEPETFFTPPQLPEAIHEVAFVEFQVSVTTPPETTDNGSAVKTNVGIEEVAVGVEVAFDHGVGGGRGVTTTGVEEADVEVCHGVELLHALDAPQVVGELHVVV